MMQSYQYTVLWQMYPSSCYIQSSRSIYIIYGILFPLQHKVTLSKICPHSNGQSLLLKCHLQAILGVILQRTEQAMTPEES